VKRQKRDGQNGERKGGTERKRERGDEAKGREKRREESLLPAPPAH